MTDKPAEPKCKKHPRYKAIRSPRRTREFPSMGCPTCFDIWNDKQVAIACGEAPAPTRPAFQPLSDEERKLFWGVIREFAYVHDDRCTQEHYDTAKRLVELWLDRCQGKAGAP